MSGTGSSGAGESEQAGRLDRQNFLRRTASALVLAPLALLVGFVGGPVFAAACAITAAVVLWEWSALVSRQADCASSTQSAIDFTPSPCL